MYNYHDAICKDIKDVLSFWDPELDPEDLWDDDSVTGNGGMYYDTEEACSAYLNGNWELLLEALYEFELTVADAIKHIASKDIARWCDCIIRCYLFHSCLDEVLHDNDEESN